MFMCMRRSVTFSFQDDFISSMAQAVDSGCAGGFGPFMEVGYEWALSIYFAIRGHQ